MTTSTRLDELFAAERTVRGLHHDLLDAAPADLIKALSAATQVALAEAADEQSLRLARIASLLQHVHGPESVDLLLNVLDKATPEGRLAAGEALEGIAFERFKEVALGVERALEGKSVGAGALSELPYILAEVGEPGVVKLLAKFLAHSDAEVVASAIEALTEIGDPTAIPALEHYTADPRTVTMEEDGEEETYTLGDLATEAIEILEESDAG